MVIYNAQKRCILETKIKHFKPEFENLQNKINELTNEAGEFYSRLQDSILDNLSDSCKIISISIVY